MEKYCLRREGSCTRIYMLRSMYIIGQCMKFCKIRNGFPPLALTRFNGSVPNFVDRRISCSHTTFLTLRALDLEERRPEDVDC